MRPGSEEPKFVCSKRVIGGELELTPALLAPPASDHELPPRLPFATGRGALHRIARLARERSSSETVLLPDYLCASVIRAVEDAGCVVAFYPVTLNLVPDMPQLLARVAEHPPAAVLLIEYFGLVDLTAPLAELSRLDSHPLTIVDRAQTPEPQSRYDNADYEFTSLRKSLPVPDGADARYRGARLDPVGDREASFIDGKVAGKVLKAFPGTTSLPDATHLQFTEGAEAVLDNTGGYGCAMSRVSRLVLSHLDLTAAAQARRANFEHLASHLVETGLRPIVDLAPGATPLFLPILHPSRNRLRAALAAERIFCPVHWPAPSGVASAPDSLGARLWSEELSLVIDQRYGQAEMDRLGNTLGAALRQL